MRWTSNKIKRLRELYRSMPNPQIGTALGCTGQAVRAKAKSLGLRKFGLDGRSLRESEAVEHLRDRIEELEGMLGLNIQLPNEFGLTPLEMKIFGMLIRRDIVNRDTIYGAVYGGLSESQQPDIEVINVHIHKIRNKVLPQGYAIRNYYNVGYYMDAGDRASLEGLCAARVAA